MHILVVLDVQNTCTLLKNGHVENINTMNEFSKSTSECIKMFLEDNTGYENEPIICIGRIGNEDVRLQKHFDDVSEFIPVVSGNIILEAEIPDDEVVSLDFESLLEYDEYLENSENPFITKAYKDKFKKCLHLGPQKNLENEICFIPCLRFNDCKYYVKVSDTWTPDGSKVSETDNLDMERLEAFA